MEQERRLGFALVRAAKAYLRVSARGLAELGLQQGQDAVLRHLWSEDGLPQSTIVERLSVEPPTITKMLARLEKTGFVKRRRDPQHPKQWRVYLTPKGKKVEAAVKKHWDAMDALATRGLAPVEVRTFVELALRVRDGVDPRRQPS